MFFWLHVRGRKTKTFNSFLLLKIQDGNEKTFMRSSSRKCQNLIRTQFLN
jgi:hypothetical protein